MGAPLGRSPRAQLKTEGDINVKRVFKKMGVRQFRKCAHVF